MNSLAWLFKTPGLRRAFPLDINRTRSFLSDRSFCKDGKTSDEDDGKGDKKSSDKLTPKDPSAVTTSIPNFQIFKNMPPDIDEMFLRRNERFRKPNLNDLLRKEMNQILLKEKEIKLDQNGVDRNKVTPVTFKRNTIFDPKLDIMIKSLLSETQSVIKKMSKQSLSSPKLTVPQKTAKDSLYDKSILSKNLRSKSTKSKALEEEKNSSIMSKGTLPPIPPAEPFFEHVKAHVRMSSAKSGACSIPPRRSFGKSSRGESSNNGNTGGSDGCKSGNHGGSEGGSNNGQNPPPLNSSDVIVSPYVDSEGNIDYTKAVVKSSGGDSAARDILKKMLQDPVKPLPTFEIVRIPQQTETVLLRGDRSIRKIQADSVSTSEQTQKTKTKVESGCSAKKIDNDPRIVKTNMNQAKKPDACTKRKQKVINKCKDKSKQTKSKSKSQCNTGDARMNIQITVKPADCKMSSIMRTKEIAPPPPPPPITPGKQTSQTPQSQPRPAEKDGKTKGAYKERVEKDNKTTKPDGKCG